MRRRSGIINSQDFIRFSEAAYLYAVDTRLHGQLIPICRFNGAAYLYAVDTLFFAGRCKI